MNAESNQTNHKRIYLAGGITIAILVIVLTALITRMLTLNGIQTAAASDAATPDKPDTPTPTVSASPVALATTPPTASRQPANIPSTTTSEKPYGVFDPSEFTVTYSTAPAKDANCGLPEGPLIIPQELPKPSWDRVQPTLLLPSNPQTGPTKTTGNVRHCYAKTGPGLIYAAANHAYQNLIYTEFQSDEAQAITLLESYRLAYAKEGAKKNDGGSQKGSHDLKSLQPIGWDILNIDEKNETADVLIYSHGELNDGRVGDTKTLVPLAWDKGDWRIAGHVQTDPARGDFTGMRKFE